MSFEGLARKYLEELQVVCERLWKQGNEATELATRPITHNFIAGLAEFIQPDMSVLHDSTVTGTSNRPDWIFLDNNNYGVYCYGDHKGLNPTSEYQLKGREPDQVQRYLDMGRPVFVFDGLEFAFFETDLSSVQRMQLVSKPLPPTGKWSELPINNSIEAKFRELFQAVGFRQWTEKLLVEQLAQRARGLSESIQHLLAVPIEIAIDPDEKMLLTGIHELNTIIQEHHDPGLSDSEACGDFIAQVLIFGLFYAHTQSSDFDNPEDRKGHIDDFWSSVSLHATTDKLMPFQAVLELLNTSLTLPNDISFWYDDVISLLSHVEYIGSSVEPTDYHSLFEAFLSEFNPRLRFDRGVFYTPPLLANWIVRATNELVIDKFGSDIPNVAETVIDPCCGTGGFIEELLKVCDFNSEQSSKIVGFEILPAPYALANYRINQLTNDLDLDVDVNIILTDTISDFVVSPPDPVDNGFSKEINRAHNLSTPPLKVIIGNPPSSDKVESGAPRTHIESLMSDFRPPQSQISSRQNIQQGMNNEAYRFLRWCSEKIIETGSGVMSLVMPGAMSSALSFVEVRKWILNNFDEVYVLKFDKDLRTGGVGSSLFQVQQGRLVIIGIKGTSAKSGNKIKYCDISDFTLSEKKQFLESSEGIEDKFNELEVNSFDFRFSTIGDYEEDLWESCWPIIGGPNSEGIFKQKCSGVKLAPTSLLFHTDINVLKRRCVDVGAVSAGTFTKSYEELIQQWWAGQQVKPKEIKLTREVRAAVFDSVREPDSYIKYNFRPFTEGVCLQNASVYTALRNAPGDGARNRPEIIEAFKQGAVGLCISPSTEDLGDHLHRFVSFSHSLPDNDNVARGNAMVFCDKYPDAKPRSGPWNSQANSNISQTFLDAYKGGDNEQDVLFYIYAIMSSQEYLDRFSGILYGPSDPNRPPRIPVFKDADLKTKLVELGKSIAECESDLMDCDQLECLDNDWGLSRHSMKISKWIYKKDDQSIIIQDEDGSRVAITGVPSGVFDLEISGHNILKKWTRERKYSYLRRAFTYDDLNSLINLITRINIQLELLHQVSDLLKEKLFIDEVLAP